MKKFNWKKKRIVIGAVLAVLLGICAGGVLYYRSLLNQSGILLSFDDYNAENWESHFDLLEEYDARVTFFINAYAPTEFCRKAVDRGHEIGFHTAEHAIVTELSEEELYEQAIAPIEEFRKEGFELTSFAYPKGEYNEETNEILLQHYKTLRGAYRHDLHQKITFRNNFVESKPIDNIKYESDEEFEKEITALLTQAKENKRAIVSLYSHAIEGGDWCIKEKRLEFLLKTAKEMGLKFYTYKDLQ